MTNKKPPARPQSKPTALLGDIRVLIETARQRAGYGKEVLPTLAEQLVRDYGNSFMEKNLRRMVQFAVVFPDESIVVTLSRQLSWSHFVRLLPLKDSLQRDYYA
jgi:hypothetical protein